MNIERLVQGINNSKIYVFLFTMLFNVFSAYESLLEVILMSLACLEDFVNNY